MENEHPIRKFLSERPDLTPEMREKYRVSESSFVYGKPMRQLAFKPIPLGDVNTEYHGYNHDILNEINNRLSRLEKIMEKLC